MKIPIKYIPRLALLVVMLLLPLTFILSHVKGSKRIHDWVVPEAAKKTKNPLKATAETLKAGKSVYEIHCKSCHGSKGKGDGTKAKSLNSSCGDFTTSAFQSQTDGALFYKLKEGRDEMPSYKKKIPDETDLWSVVIYMRAFGAAVKAEDSKKQVVSEEKKKPSENDNKTSGAKIEEKPVKTKNDSMIARYDSTLVSDSAKIVVLLALLEKAINASDTSALIKLYHTDAIYIPLLVDTSYGKNLIKETYQQQFLQYKSNIHFILNDLQIWKETAIVMATIKGERKVLLSNKTENYKSRVLMVLRVTGNEWKLFRQMNN